MNLPTRYTSSMFTTGQLQKLFGADRTIPIEERVDSAVKRVQKLSASAKSEVGKTSLIGSSTVKRGGAAGRGGINYNGGRQRNYDRDFRQRDFFYGISSNGASGSYGDSGNGRDSGQRTCFICRSTGIRPSNVLKATSLKLCASFPNGKCVLKPVGCVSWSSPSDVA